jgi:Putative viral replication protein.
MARTANWLLTDWEDKWPTDEEYEPVWKRAEDVGWSYQCNGRERCPETGRVHYHVYLEFPKPVTMGKLKKLLGTPWIHIEPRRGSQKQAIDYCRKDGVWEEFGQRKTSRCTY